jgi:hypothetical protein
MLGPDDLVCCAGTLLRGSFEDLVAVASAGGFRALSLWPHPVEAARAGGCSDAELRARLEDAGVVAHERGRTAAQLAARGIAGARAPKGSAP